MAYFLASVTQVIVVTFNPNLALLSKNLDALTGQFSHILVVDNGSNNQEEINSLLLNHPAHPDVRNFKQNTGIAFALNMGLEIANVKRLDWLLTMDQDTVISRDFSRAYEKLLSQEPTTVLLGWRATGNPGVYHETFNTITSGCLTNVNKALIAGGYDEKLFIYHVDTDLALRMHHFGKVISLDGIGVKHSDGILTLHKMFFGSYYIREHSAIANYYTVRNSVLLLKRFFFRHPIFSFQGFVLTPIVGNIRLILFGQHKIASLKLIAKAYRDGFLNHGGIYSESED